MNGAVVDTRTWMGEIPRHWQVKALKFCADLVGDRVDGSTSVCPYVGLEHIESQKGRLLRLEGSQETAESTVSRFSAGDVLFGKLRPYLAKAAVADIDGVCSSEILVYRPHAVESEYLKHVMLLGGFIEVVNASTYGSKMPRADAAFVSRLAIPLPCRAEQVAIAAYLDVEIARIDALIELKRDLKRTLKELRLNTATTALHGGLLSQQKVDSGITWIGKIPPSWTAKRLKHVVDTVEQGWSPQCEGGPAEVGSWGVLKAGACNGGEFRVDENKALPPSEQARPELEVKAGNVLMSRASGSIDLVGSVAYVGATQEKLMLSDKLFRLRIGAEADPEWLSLFLNTGPMRRQIASYVRGSEGLARNIASSDIRELWLAVPPIDEQRHIAAYVKTENARIDVLAAHIDSELALLHELRSTTIADAVLGRIDVRKHARH